ncbi:MAG TPA: hypothetical protein PKD54_01325, partial [Pirellulaceae bacterium]|nr:hypothetical protein [Pirellulaceae bacterium]
MSGAVEGIKAISGLFRTLILLLVAAGLGWGGWLGYSQFVVPAMESRAALAQVETLKVELTDLQTQLTANKQML